MWTSSSISSLDNGLDTCKDNLELSEDKLDHSGKDGALAGQVVQGLGAAEIGTAAQACTRLTRDAG